MPRCVPTESRGGSGAPSNWITPRIGENTVPAATTPGMRNYCFS